MTVTGTVAWCMQYVLTEPISASASAPYPRQPTTSNSAPSAALTSTSGGCPSITCVCTQDGHSRPGTSVTAAARVSSATLARSTSSGLTGAQPKNAGYSQATTASSSAPARLACSTAQRTASLEPGEPSAPTNRQIGERLFLAEKTVKNYVPALFANLGMERRTQAAAYAARIFEDHGPPQPQQPAH